MNIRTGNIYQMRNEVTGQRWYYSLHDIIQTGGNMVAFGTCGTHTVYVPRTLGIVPVDEHACSFPIFPQANAEDVVKYMEELESNPIIMLLDNPHYIPVPNISRSEPPTDKEGMVQESVMLIQGFEHWKVTHTLPFWLRERLHPETAANSQAQLLG